MRRLAFTLLALPLAAMLFPAIYNHARPALLGIPFFYWYQLAWVVLTAAILGFVGVMTRKGSDV